MLELKTLRKRSLNQKPAIDGPVIYWMQRDQRVRDNWAFFYTLEQARSVRQPIMVVFCLQNEYLGVDSKSAHYAFMWQGLKQVSKDLSDSGIPWLILEGLPQVKLAELAFLCQAGLVVTDFSPLRQPRIWKDRLAEALHCRLEEVDAHNIVPCWEASPKQEYGARTFRPKIGRVLSEWMMEYPVMPNPQEWLNCGIDNSSRKLSLNSNLNDKLDDYIVRTRILMSGAGLDYATYQDKADLPIGGSDAAEIRLGHFIRTQLKNYDKRNDPNQDAVSGLSPYLHFGHLSAQTAALAVKEAAADDLTITAQAADFMEELIVRRELSDNYCFYNSDYDNRSGWPEWARKTLDFHRNDLRVYQYNLEQMESGLTHDPLWNAVQKNLMKSLSMPGYLRMYWAKKILEWSPDPETAQEWAIVLNDRYMLDGRDPNGYTGIAWSIAGLHDRPWVQRPVFGQIRFMSLSGCRRKFDVDKWIEKCNLVE